MRRMATKEELKGLERGNLAPEFCCFPNILPACPPASGPALQHKGASPAQMSHKDAKKKKKKKRVQLQPSILTWIHCLNLLAFLFDLMGGEIFGEEQPSERLWLMEVAKGLSVQLDTWSG